MDAKKQTTILKYHFVKWNENQGVWELWCRLTHEVIGSSQFQVALLLTANELEGNIEKELKQTRQVSASELADLSEEWENSTVDTSKYYQNVMEAYEVSEKLYHFHKARGRLCQVKAGRYYVA